MYVANPREREQTIAAFLSVANAQQLFAEYQTRQVPFVHRLKKEPWGQSSSSSRTWTGTLSVSVVERSALSPLPLIAQPDRSVRVRLAFRQPEIALRELAREAGDAIA